ncbi:AMP-binding protein [Oceanibaculum pacificum]|uniref:AMP-dependent synthetase n=1 Tax=Oceanibaculum pacificum TaxID=580166 RepID=A0A154WGR4_9PROT|nr:AMP-binding protein [Oceanibaculum pacificum]KZD12702.1 AMP-dependent synthetase [Oceanibaculum pacificum]
MSGPYPDPALFDTFPKLLLHNAAGHADEVAMRQKDFGIWREMSWGEYNEKVKLIALGLSALGIGKGDVVGLIGDNDMTWVCGELAAQTVRAMSLGIYRDALDEEVFFLADYAQAKAVIAEDQEQVDKFLNLGARLPALQHIIYVDPRGMGRETDPRVRSLDALMALGQEAERQQPGRYQALVAATDAEDVAILCTTSGTTSNPKLAMLQSGRMVRHVLRYMAVDPKDATDEYVSVLPLPWIMEQIYCIGFSLVSRMKLNFPESPDTLMHDMREIGPTFLLLAPRLWEQLAADMRARIMDASSLNRWIFDKGMKLGVEAVERGQRSGLADAMLFSALRDRLGFSRVRSAATGGSALGPDTFKMFLAMGVPLRQLYGQTELMGAYTLQDGKDLDCDTVGAVFEGTEVRIDDPDPSGIGEIVTRHDNMFLGYYKNEAATNADIRDGWMYTGDAGFFDAKNRLVVIDRLKDIATTAQGLRFSPQYIENKLKFSPYIAEAVILGAGRDYLTAIICIRYSIVSKWGEKNRIAFTSYTDLSNQQQVYDLIAGEIEQVNESLPEAQRIQKFLLLYKELDADDGELTRTRKVRRGVISERYGLLIDALYSEADTAHLDAEVTFEDGRKGRVMADMRIQAIGSGSGDIKKAS